jgi:two-component system response regulator FixJ
MEHDFDIWVVDEVELRATAVAKAIARCGERCKVFPSVARLPRRPTAPTIIFAHDAGDPGNDAAAYCGKVRQRAVAVLYSNEHEAANVVSAIGRGARDYLFLPVATEKLLLALARAKSAYIMANLPTRSAMGDSLGHLSQRERQVLAGMVNGESSRIAGQRLGISARTVEVHRANVKAKLGARNIAEAIKLAIEAGVTEAA